LCSPRECRGQATEAEDEQQSAVSFRFGRESASIFLTTAFELDLVLTPAGVDRIVETGISQERNNMADFDIRELLEAGTHFGHQTRRWNPKMDQYIFTQRNGIHIIDLQKTLGQLEKAYKFVMDTVRAGKPVLFVGTKKQAVDIVRQEAERSGMFYVTERWLGGMLTNWQTLRQSIRHLDYLDRISADGTYEKLKKKEVLLLEKERARLSKILAGIRQLTGLPGLVFVVDVKKEHIAVKEAQKLGVPSVAIVDTNCDPDSVTCPIPGNDDALRSISVITRIIADAAIEGRATKDAADKEAAEVREEGSADGGQEAPAQAQEAVAT
jgi:small subunit ribosomal protein S2